MPHLNELQTAFGPQGFRIVAVSDEPASKIGPFMYSNGVNYGVARATGVLRLYNESGYPSAWLIDPSGRVAFAGHPMEINSRLISSLLPGAVARPDMPVQSSSVESSSWWIWLIVVPAILFAAAMGWFLWSSRDRTGRHVQAAWYPPQAYSPQGVPPPGAPPPGAPPPYPSAQGPAAGPQPVQMQPQAEQDHGQTGYSAPLPGYGPAQMRVTGGAGRYGVDGLMESPGSATRRRERVSDPTKPYLGGEPSQPPAPTRPQQYGQRPPQQPSPPLPRQRLQGQQPYPPQGFQQPLSPEPIDEEPLSPEPLSPDDDEFPPYDTNQNRPGGYR